MTKLKEFLIVIGWQDHSGKTNWKEVQIDLSILGVILGGAVIAAYLY